jgi:multiple sugar transport system substrate-binding protein
MLRRRQKLALAVLSAVIGLSLAGCGGASGPKAQVENQATTGNQPIKLRIAWWGGQARHDATLKILDLYTKKNPNITFEPEYSGFEGFVDKLSTQAAAKNAPDIMQIDANWLADWNARGQFADLSSINIKDIDPSLLPAGKYKDKQTAIPLGNNAWGIMYDKSALDKLGIAQPKDGWTWDDYFKLAHEIKSKLDNDHYVLQDGTLRWEMYTSYQLSKGKGYPATPDGKFNYDRDTWLEWVKIFSDLRKEGIVPPPDISVSDKDLDPKLDILTTGKIIFKAVHAAQVTSWDSLKPGSIGVQSMPKAQQAGSWLKATFYFTVSQDSKHKEEAKKFIDWFINDPEVGEIAGTTRGIPVSSKIVAQLQPKFTASDKLTVDMINKSTVGAQQYYPSAKGWSNFNEKDFKDITQALVFGKITPEKSFEDLKARAMEYEKK